MDGPALMSILEFYTQVGLRDRRRETAIQASKKEREKTSIQCQTQPTERRQAAQLCERVWKSLTWERPRGRHKGLGGHRA